MDPVIAPDTKDWTWVLDRPCPECAFDAAALVVSATAQQVRALVEPWQTVLSRPDATSRRIPDRWSDLEYGCHVRDVFRLFDHRLERMLCEDDPLFANWDQDVTAVEDRYAEQDPDVVSAELGAAAETLAARFDTIDDDAWHRPGRRSDGAVFTVESFARYLLHDPIHHLWDVRR